MPKLSDLRTARHVRAEDLRDPEIRAEYERTALAHAVAMRVLKYRTDHGLSQSALGRAGYGAAGDCPTRGRQP